MSSSKVAKILDKIEAKLAEIEKLVKTLREEEEEIISEEDLVVHKD